jgi:hypothetical protein
MTEPFWKDELALSYWDHWNTKIGHRSCAFPKEIICLSDPCIDIPDTHHNESLVGNIISPLPCEIEWSTERERDEQD